MSKSPKKEINPKAGFAGFDSVNWDSFVKLAHLLGRFLTLSSLPDTVKLSLLLDSRIQHISNALFLAITCRNPFDCPVLHCPASHHVLYIQQAFDMMVEGDRTGFRRLSVHGS